MYFIFTILLGWMIISLLISIIETIFQLNPGYIKDPTMIYILIGYCVMAILGIKSPLTKNKGNPFTEYKTIEIKIFFQDIYYAIWWPCYILRKLKK